MANTIISKWYYLFACITLSGVIAAAYIYIRMPLYKAESTVKVADSFGSGQASAGKAATEAQVIKSRRMLEKALNDLDFNVEYRTKRLMQIREVYSNSPIKVDYKAASQSFSSQSFNININENNYSLSYDAGSISVDRAGSYDKELDLGFVKLTISKTPYFNTRKTDGLTQYSFSISSEHAVAVNFENNNYIDVKQADGNANAVCISVVHPVAEKASRLANALAYYYGKNETENNRAYINANLDVINNQLASVSAELSQIESDITRFKSENKIIDIPQETQAGLQTLGQLQVQKVETNLQIAALDNLSDYLRNNRQVNNIAPEYGTVNDLIYTETLLKLNDKAKERQHAEETGADVTALDKEIDALKDNLAESIRNTRKKLAVKSEEINSAIASARASFTRLPETENELQQLNRNLYLNTKVYDHLIQKRAEAMVALPVIPLSTQIIDEAITPSSPFAPDPFRTAGYSIIIGIGAGLFFIALRTGLKSKVSNREELQRHTDIPFIANIENLGKKGEYISEPFNNLCTKMFLINQFAKTQIITVTSTQRGEGKTTVAHNLARALAQLDKRVLMIDMNSVNPALDNIFDVRSENSIADLYNGNLNVHDAISITSIPNVDLLKAGQLKSGINTFLTSAKTGVIIDDVKKSYDAVIFDTPEVSNYMDAIPLMKISDLNLYVVKANSTSQSLLSQASVIKNDYNINNMYFVLNAIKNASNYSGTAPTGNYRVLKARQQADNEVAFVPRMLKKAALWFY